MKSFLKILGLACVALACMALLGAGDMTGEWFYAAPDTQTIGMGSGATLKFSSATTGLGSFDVGLKRGAASIVAVTDGASGSGNLAAAKIGPDATHQNTLPSVNADTVALIAATQTLTNKTIASPTISGTWNFGGATVSGVGASFPLTAPTGLGAVAQFVGPTDQPTIVSSAAGNAITVRSPQGTGTTPGGSLSLLAADGGPSGGAGGTVTINAGGTHAPGTQVGPITIGGASHNSGATIGSLIFSSINMGGNGAGGSITMQAGQEGGVGTPGGVNIRGGDSITSGDTGGVVAVRGGNGLSTGAGGALTLTPGLSVSGTDGTVILQGSSAHAASTVMTINGLSAVMSSGTLLDLSAQAGILKFAAFAGAGSTTPALGTTCPASAATVHWITVKDSAGTTTYIPCWQ